MEIIDKTTTADKIPINLPSEEFKPKGAIAFFIALIILGLIIWFGIYFLMLSRS